jgi:uncharacterized SAM-binding protein YcdF (DUF218 family)
MIRSLFRLAISGLTLWIVGLFIYLFYIQHMQPYAGKAEAIVVLTGGEKRVETGLKLLAEGKAPRLLISGVHQNVKIDELIALNHQDPALAQKIELGFAAQDTSGNADETSSWVAKHHIQSMIIVTANYHMPRAMIHLGAQLPDVALYSYPVKLGVFDYHDWMQSPAMRHLILDEYNKFLLTYPQMLFLKKGLK